MCQKSPEQIAAIEAEQVRLIDEYLALHHAQRRVLEESVVRDTALRVIARPTGERHVDALGRPKYWLHGRPRITYAELRARLTTIEGHVGP
jgi:hypothetical protein